MQLWPGPEVAPEDHTDVHPAQGINRDRDPTQTECRPDRGTARRPASADEDPGRVGCRIRVAQEHDIDAMLAEHARGTSSEALPLGPV